MALWARRSFLAMVLAVALAAVGVWAVSLRAAPDNAGMSQVGAGPRFTIASGSFGEKRLGLFVIDSQTQRLLVYSVDDGTRMLRLVAVRDISQDLRMSYYNNDKPLPDDIRRSVEAAGAAGSDTPGD